MDPHAPRQMAEELMTLGLFTGHPDAERGIGEALFHNAGEFDDVFGHRESSRAEGRQSVRMETGSDKAEGSGKPGRR